MARLLEGRLAPAEAGRVARGTWGEAGGRPAAERGRVGGSEGLGGGKHRGAGQQDRVKACHPPPPLGPRGRSPSPDPFLPQDMWILKAAPCPHVEATGNVLRSPGLPRVTLPRSGL